MVGGAAVGAGAGWQAAKTIIVNITPDIWRILEYEHITYTPLAFFR
jgi:hypothetical protein